MIRQHPVLFLSQCAETIFEHSFLSSDRSWELLAIRCLFPPPPRRYDSIRPTAKCPSQSAHSPQSSHSLALMPQAATEPDR